MAVLILMLPLSFFYANTKDYKSYRGRSYDIDQENIVRICFISEEVSLLVQLGIHIYLLRVVKSHYTKKETKRNPNDQLNEIELKNILYFDE
uniref:Uncharacterized protein n=1 Tax=Megaselia scalaris TaxID=36166 RepID=T1GW64_MEGSC